MRYTVYKTVNTLNGKYYIGAHRTNNPYDDYFGSGVALNRAIEKYGRDNFKKELLHIFETSEEMFAKEAELVEIGDHTYNLMEGGKGGWDHFDNTGDNNPMRNPEVVKKQVAKYRANGSYHSEARLAANMAASAKAAEVNRGKKRPDHAVKMKSHMEERWKDKEKMRDSMATWWIVTSPDGEEFETNRLEDFCKERNLAYSTLWGTHKGRVIKRGRSVGWKCQKK